MSLHKFKVGQTVNLTPNRQDGDAPPGAYTVQRLMPGEGRDIRYRVRNSRDGHERVVQEDRLAAQSSMF